MSASGAENEKQASLANNSEADNTDSTECFACALPIPAKAVVCTHCNSYQRGWRRYVNVSHTLLALVIALISVVGTVGPALMDRFKEPASKINASLVHFAVTAFDGRTELDIQMLMSNAGDAPGVVKPEFRLSVDPPSAIRREALLYKGGAVQLNAQESEIVAWRGFVEAANPGTIDAGKLTVSAVNFDGSTSEIGVQLPSTSWK